MPHSSQSQIYRVTVSLAGVQPPVWRRLLVPADMTLASFHEALQVAFGWTDSHLHCFEVGGRRIGMVEVEDDARELEDERKVHLSSVLTPGSAPLVYRYDYGDDWKHIVALEAIEAPDPRCAYPLCIGGQRASPPEDCGGVTGYGELLAALSHPGEKEYDDRLSSVGGFFDPAVFDPNAVNRAYRHIW